MTFRKTSQLTMLAAVLLLVSALLPSCSPKAIDVTGTYMMLYDYMETGYATFGPMLCIEKDGTGYLNFNTASSEISGFLATYVVDGDRVYVISLDGTSRAVFQIMDDGNLTFLVDESTDMSKYNHTYPFDFMVERRPPIREE